MSRVFWDLILVFSPIEKYLFEFGIILAVVFSYWSRVKGRSNCWVESFICNL